MPANAGAHHPPSVDRLSGTEDELRLPFQFYLCFRRRLFALIPRIIDGVLRRYLVPCLGGNLCSTQPCTSVIRSALLSNCTIPWTLHLASFSKVPTRGGCVEATATREKPSKVGALRSMRAFPPSLLCTIPCRPNTMPQHCAQVNLLIF